MALNYWKANNVYPGIIASGQDCSAQNPLTTVDAKVQEATYACIDNELYYLVMPGETDPDTGSGDEAVDSTPQYDYGAPDEIDDLGFLNLTRADFLTGYASNALLESTR